MPKLKIPMPKWKPFRFGKGTEPPKEPRLLVYVEKAKKKGFRSK